MSGAVKEPFEVPRDLTLGFHLTQEDLDKKREEIYAQINYLLNCLRQIDMVHDGGDDVMTADEVRSYLKLDSVDKRMDIPKDIPKIRLGIGHVYYRRDVKKVLESRRRGGR